VNGRECAVAAAGSNVFIGANDIRDALVGELDGPLFDPNAFSGATVRHCTPSAAGALTVQASENAP
jgi:hypothetical protein